MLRTALRSFSRPVHGNARCSCFLATQRPHPSRRHYSSNPPDQEEQKPVPAPNPDNGNENITRVNAPKDISLDNDNANTSFEIQKVPVPPSPNPPHKGLQLGENKGRGKKGAKLQAKEKTKRQPKKRAKAPPPPPPPPPPAPASKKNPPTSVSPDEATKIHGLVKHIEEKHSGTLASNEFTLTPLDIETTPVPNLAYGLDRVLFNPGVYHLRDPRSRIYNFDPYLGNIMPVSEFDFEALKEYITSSKDEALIQLARDQKRKYVGSSSSMTTVLAHFHYLLSQWRPINRDTVSLGFPESLRSFTRLLRAPAAMFLHYKDGVYAIDADKEYDNANILMNLGKSMEKLLTVSKDEFERYRKSSENKITAEEERSIPESFHYSTLGDFVMRSQLDAYDPRLPGTGMFDLKTRAVVSIRMDVKNFEKSMGYEIKGRFGMWESYEREYYDMIRAAFLKYSLQVRVGRMDGIFVAFHNIERIFGFQYIPLSEMDLALHGQTDPTLGDKEFALSIKLWNNILDKATAKFPDQSLRLHFETRDAKVPYMYIFAEPVTNEDIKAIQEKNKAAIEEYQRRILHPELVAAEEENNHQKEDENASLDAVEDVEDTFEAVESTDDNITSVESGSVKADDTTATSSSSKPPATTPDPSTNLLGMVLTIRNNINDKAVPRPRNLSADDDWNVDYELSELKNNSHLRQLYDAIKRRRKATLEFRGEDESFYIRKMHSLAQEGREWRAEQDRIDEEEGVFVYDSIENVNKRINSNKNESGGGEREDAQ
ncbi:mitochondrial protein Pet127-domain-containing protein [Talaromyces proteolyticus]|uniref:Mitochondrial protein Pet127-domain-containing protein n=1 Tax=Talaromyces proteolyticus TaxID=1131652 RepID=A0AAD4KEB1_9EURO|nr:mitochondrial protein Pet127-domain-containing protein [Talaromyces proteolyticus]KAH8689598.1 mitochondrial protein Pet127-domain-containing protein [Talaromyces proteolyticus]